MSEYKIREPRNTIVADAPGEGGVSNVTTKLRGWGYFPVKVGRTGHFVGVYENDAGNRIAVITANKRTGKDEPDPSRYLTLADIMAEEDLVECGKGSDENESKD